jgi:anti-sigma factor (TIGR02949 family)
MSIIDKLKSLIGAGSGDRGASGNGAPARMGGDDMISCEDALRLVNEFIDGELEGVSEARVRAHFDVCQRCYPHLKLETAFREALRRAAATEAAPTDLKARVATLLADAEAEG